MSELTPEQQAELALVRAIADSLRRRMPDLSDRTLGRVAFHIADLLNGVAVVLTSDAGSVVPVRTAPTGTPPAAPAPANPVPPRPQPLDATQPMPRATDGPPAGYPATGVTGDPAARPRARFPVRPARTSGEFPAQPRRTSGEFPAQPVGPIPGAYPVRPAPDDTTTQLPAIRATGEIPAVRPTGEYPAVRRPTGGEYPAVRRPGETGTQRPAQPRIRFPSASRRPQPPPPALPPSEPADGDYLTEAPKGPWIAEFFQLDGTPLEEAQWAERDQALRGIAGRIRWLAFDGTEVTVRLRGPGGIDMDHEAVLAAIERMRRG